MTGAVAAARPDDYIISAYRDQGHALARGTSANACLAELFECSHRPGFMEADTMAHCGNSQKAPPCTHLRLCPEQGHDRDHGMQL